METIFGNQKSLIEREEGKVVLPYPQNYGIYTKLIEDGIMDINTEIFYKPVTNYSKGTEEHIDWIINIFKDGIEHKYIQNLKLNVIFTDGISLHLNIVDYLYNLFFWNMISLIGDKITSDHLFFEENINQRVIKNYIDNKFINKYRKKLSPGQTPEERNIELNRIIDRCLSQLYKLDAFAFYLADTINIEDDILLCKKNPRYNQLLHSDLSNVPIEDVQNVGMQLTKEAINILKETDHCLADSFRAEQGINPKQFKEFAINIGTAPDGVGGVFPTIVNNSFINGGTNTLEYQHVESSKGRSAQIIAKCNVGKSGHFARLLGLNNRECTILHHDPIYDCGSRNYEVIIIEDEDFLKMFKGRYYRLNPNGMEYLMQGNEKHLIGSTIYLRSPMTCASHARGRGICYKCYGDLAYTNSSINVGQLAAELLSAALTQRLLSAKHLLASMVRKLEWSEGFTSIFDLVLNVITLHEDTDYTGWTLRINPDEIIYDSEEEEYEYNEYVENFEVRDPQGKIYPIYTRERDHIYFTKEMNDFIRTNGEDCVSDDGYIEIDMNKLTDTVIFIMNISNIEYSQTLEDIKSIINKEKVTTSFDRNSILQQFVSTVIKGGLSTTAVHLEVILSNQIRSADNIFLNPNWDNIDEPYQIITLNKALTDNPSITVSMSYQKLSKTLYNPLSFSPDKSKPSLLDLLFMRKPQEYMCNRHLIKDNYKPKSDVEASKSLIDFIDGAPVRPIKDNKVNLETVK